MITIDLNGRWQMKRTQDTEWMEAVVPGSVYADLLRSGRMEDPFYRDNEDAALALMDDDYEYTRTFELTSEALAGDQLLLRCEGLDTLARIILNGQTLASTDNMHRTYEFDIKGRVVEGENELRIVFSSPNRFVAERHAANPLYGVSDALPGFPHLRKVHSMFGWDWGPKLPDAGIWRNISIVSHTAARLHDVYIAQEHRNGSVKLSVDVSALVWTEEQAEAELIVKGTDGSRVVYTGKAVLNKDRLDRAAVQFQVEIADPELWWPNGYGEQPLYTVEVRIVQEGSLLEGKQYTIGLRTLRVNREPDQWGESFAFEVNGVEIFAQGANYIPEDNVLTRVSIEQTERLLLDCIEANFNCIRIWGGGFYPSNEFYALCDKYGLIVWQDFLFACAVYEMTDAFTENIRQEAIDNVKRLRHHASLALWCGNNEMEWGWEEWDFFEKIPRLRADYIKQFEVVLSDVVKKYDPQRFYWPSSPSSGGSFDKPNSENYGDVHYWDVWHGLKPFTDYRNFYFRFCSEFGFQSFPDMKTIESFTLPQDRNIFSYVMEKHQKNGAANGKILYYLSENFKYPKDFESMVYASQLLQAEAIKYGVEHWRRNRGRCMGSIYWQLNDCWPVASWSSIDYYGRWKALHYFAKRFYAPVLLSACEEGTGVTLHVTNETMSLVSGTIHWKLRDHRSGIVKEGSAEITVDALQAKQGIALDFREELSTGLAMRQSYLEFMFVADGREVSGGTVLFTKAKHFDFLDPQIAVEVSETKDGFVIGLRAEAFAKYVGLQLAEADGRFDDNFFDLSGSASREVVLDKSSLSEALTLEQLKQQLRVTSLYDLA
ncbi:beta-mannosidase [Paenibacillus abyssi]|uniref:Beta-mannosidase B n=1 Tax=Paenibacillus abyssi TaxID=1340531 RepID=A0A917FS84_9BACL|nr:glycoside hydrolase family 2 protein [Paenibacillus abyssi]GGG03594.1 beta-mannosidase [Paenibacillus abyssi]